LPFFTAVDNRQMTAPPPLTITAWRERLRGAGAGPEHEARWLREWLQCRDPALARRKPEHHLPLALRQAQPALLQARSALAQVAQAETAADGAERLLVRLHDGATVESVRLAPTRTPAVCVSTQVGCAVGCTFCQTGRGGLERQLGSAEIVAQVVLARQRGPVAKVVFMGMGEPAHNLEAVLEAITTLGQEGGIGHKQLVFSTVGDQRAFAALAAMRVKPALALSLHTTKPALREQLLPRAPRLSPAELVAAADDYARASGYPGQLQWTLLHGVNDGDDELEALATLLAGRRLMLNLIPFNRVDGSGFERPPIERAAEMARWLHRRGILTKLRTSDGQDVDGGCGQLRARHAPVVRVHRRATMSEGAAAVSAPVVSAPPVSAATDSAAAATARAGFAAEAMASAPGCQPSA
jgi:23S rRNA (adenine2503-C2)-methyltransferase